MIPAPVLPVLWMHEGCDAGESLAHGKHIRLGWFLQAGPRTCPGKRPGVLQNTHASIRQRKGAGGGHGAVHREARAALCRRNGSSALAPSPTAVPSLNPSFGPRAAPATPGADGHPQPGVAQQLAEAAGPGALEMALAALEQHRWNE